MILLEWINIFTKRQKSLDIINLFRNLTLVDNRRNTLCLYLSIYEEKMKYDYTIAL